MNIGFIGSGQMGKRMARHILDAGFPLVVHDLNRESAGPLVEKGAVWKDTPKDVAGASEVVITCLPGPPEVEAVVYGKDGLLSGWKTGNIYVDMSTNSPGTIRRIAADAARKGVAMLDAPVSGGTPGAEAGTLTIMVGGEAATMEKVRKVLESMGKNIFHVGEVGCGNTAKVINNMMSATCNAITAECFVLGVKAGMDPKVLREVITKSSGNNYWLEQNYPSRVFKGNFEPGFRITLAIKDIGLAMQLAKECGVVMPISANVEQRFLEARAAGLAEKGTQAIILPLEKLAGVEVRVKE